MTAAESRAVPLALPAVPLPAAADHPWRDRMLIGVFAALLAAGFAGAVFNRDRTVTLFENRNAAPWPTWPATAEAERAWPRAFEAAFADRFGGRETLIALHHGTKVHVFGVSPIPTTMIGRDGWLYFLGEDGKALDRDYRGVAPFPADEPARMAAEFKRRHDFLAALGIAYVVMIVPDKATIYPEQLPQWVKKRPAPTRLDRLYAALAAYPDLNVIDLRPALGAAKTRGRLYYKTDSHWNFRGAAVGYEQLAAVVKTVLPGFPAVPPEPPAWLPGPDYVGDIARGIGLPHAFREGDGGPVGKDVGNAPPRCAHPATVPFSPGRHPPVNETYVFECARPGLPSAVVYRDSMAIPLVPLLAENFRRVVFISDRHLARAFVKTERPDIVIDEIVERGMHIPAAFPM